MHKDFHYYGTYLAAIVAGFTAREAQTIAYAAQYVDDSSSGKIKNGSSYYITDFTPVPTVHTNAEIFSIFALKSLTETLQNEIARVWSCFHFLPGNYDKATSKKHTGEKTYPALSDSWTFDKKAEEQFKLMCLPSSEIVQEMINDITYQRKSQHYYLELLGIRMHALADTWAHMYHGGLSAWFMNDAYDVKELDSSLRPNGKTLIWVYDPLFDDILAANKYACTMKTTFFNSFSYLGHGRMGHFPDYGFKRYSYRPCWSKDAIIKNNQEDFLSAFKQMVKAMVCVRDGKHFDNGFAELPKQVETKVRNVIAKESKDQSAEWKTAIADLGYTALPDYDENAWLISYEHTKSAESNYYCFNLAAALQVNLVKAILRRHDIYLDEIPYENKTRVKLKNVGKNNYYGQALRYLTYDYPRPAISGVELTFINPVGALKSGDVVEIRTNEPQVPNDYSYLMAWSTPSLYYQAREYGMNRSKWELEIKGEPAETPITAEKKIYIKNVHHKDTPCIEQHFSLLPPMGNYFTTTARSGKNEQLWTIEPVETGKSYYILCNHSNHVWQVDKLLDGDEVIRQGPLTFGEHQKFGVTYIDKRSGFGKYAIHSLYTGKALDITKEGQLVQSPYPLSEESRTFDIPCRGDGYCHILTNENESVRVDRESALSGATIGYGYDESYGLQTFAISAVFGSNAFILCARAFIGNRWNTMSIGAKDTSKEAQTEPMIACQFDDSRRFRFDMISLDEPNLFSFENRYNGLYLDIAEGSCEDGAALVQRNANNSDSQKFYMLGNSVGKYWIVNKASRKLITLPKFSTGEPVIQYHRKSPDSQMFRLVRAD